MNNAPSTDLNNTTDNQIKYKPLLAFALPYLMLCAGLWHIGYWSTFKINILQYLDIADIIKSFIYPFISSVAFYFGGQIIMTLFFQNSLFWQKTFPYGGAEQVTKPKTLKIIRIFLIVIAILNFTMLFLWQDTQKWIWIFFSISIFLGVFLNNRNFLDTIIQERNLRLNIVYTIVLIPCLSFGLAKKASYDVYDNSNKDTIVASIVTNQDKDTNSSTVKYKLLGITHEFVFTMSMDNKTITMLPRTDIKQIIIRH